MWTLPGARATKPPGLRHPKSGSSGNLCGLFSGAGGCLCPLCHLQSRAFLPRAGAAPQHSSVLSGPWPRPPPGREARVPPESLSAQDGGRVGCTRPSGGGGRGPRAPRVLCARAGQAVAHVQASAEFSAFSADSASGSYSNRRTTHWGAEVPKVTAESPHPGSATLTPPCPVSPWREAGRREPPTPDLQRPRPSPVPSCRGHASRPPAGPRPSPRPTCRGRAPPAEGTPTDRSPGCPRSGGPGWPLVSASRQTASR